MPEPTAPTRPRAGAGGSGGDEGVWLSAHLYSRGAGIYGGAVDAVALDVVAPLVDALRARRLLLGWFFVRYSDGGPHLRLRLRVRAADAAEAADEVLAHARANAPHADLEPWTALRADAAAPAAPSSAGRSSPAPDGDSAEGSVLALRWVGYEPELGRYGGAQAIEVAERVFEASSALTLALLPGVAGRARPARLGRGLLAMLATLHVYCGARGLAADFAEQYGAGYLRTLSPDDARVSASQRMFRGGFARQEEALSANVEEVWACLNGGLTSPALDAYRVALARERDALGAACARGGVAHHGAPVRDWHACVGRIVPSYLHMTSNRLGVSIPEEAYLAHLVRWTLDSAPAPRAGAPAPARGRADPAAPAEV